MTPEQTELIQLRARVRELEAAQRQLEIYAEDLRRTFAELRRQLGHMNELHRVSTMIGSVLEPGEVIDGMEHVDKIAKGEPPAKPDVMQKVYILGDVKR